MDHFVRLEQFPAGLRFPPDLHDRIRYDAEHRRLIFRGFMSKAEFDRLCKLSDDWNFRRQLEELFRLSVPDESPPSGLRRFVAALTGIGF